MDAIQESEYESRKRLYEEIKRFTRNEQEELYRILRKGGEELSENRNGIFFDLMSVKQETFLKVKEWIEFCKKNRNDFEVREQELSQLAQDNPGIFQG